MFTFNQTSKYLGTFFGLLLGIVISLSFFSVPAFAESFETPRAQSLSGIYVFSSSGSVVYTNTIKTSDEFLNRLAEEYKIEENLGFWESPETSEITDYTYLIVGAAMFPLDYENMSESDIAEYMLSHLDFLDAVREYTSQIPETEKEKKDFYQSVVDIMDQLVIKD